MKRRTLIKSTAAVVGYGFTAATVATFVTGCEVDQGDGWNPEFLSKDEAATLAEVCERIIPKTDTPGAKDAMVHRYIDAFIPANIGEEDAGKFKSALGEFDEVARELHGKKFVKLAPDEMDSVLNAIADSGGEMNIFDAVKGMTIPAFFTSEIGAKQVLKFDPIPGTWDACIPLTDVGGTWAL